jgi:hypothetical protein
MSMAPDQNALRRDRPSDPAWTQLTPRAADAPVPEWPLTEPNARELELWRREWQRPQANEWIKHDEVQGVALFVRLLAQAEKPNAPVTMQKYIREWRHELGISANGCATRRWKMPAAGQTASVTQLRSVEQPRRQSSRDRVKRAAPTDPPPF